MIIIRKRFDDQVHSVIECSEGKTDQSFRDSCDINYIMERYMKKGVAPVMRKEGLYDDFSNVMDYQEAQNCIIEAEEQFRNLPASLRKRFENDPGKFLIGMENASDQDLIEMGLKEPERPPQTEGTDVAEEPEENVEPPA